MRSRTFAPSAGFVRSTRMRWRSSLPRCSGCAERRGPGGRGRRAERLQRLREAKERLEREAAAAAKARQEHLLQRQAEEAAIGKKKRGRKPKGGGPGAPAEAKANTTDPDSRIMKTRHGYVPGYNGQAGARGGR